MLVYRHKASILIMELVIVFIFFIFIVFVSFYAWHPTFRAYIGMISGVLSIIVSIVMYKKYRIVIDEKKIFANTLLTKKTIFFEEIETIMEDGIWPYYLFGVSYYYIIPRADLKKKRIIIWPFFNNRLQLLNHIIEKTKPYNIEIDPMVMKHLEKWKKKQARKLQRV